MNEREKQTRTKKKGGSRTGLAVIAVVFLISLFDGAGVDAIGVLTLLIVVFVAAAFLWFFLKALKGTAKKKDGLTMDAAPRQKSPPKPTEGPVYTPKAMHYEQDPQANSQRDRQRRLAQLDGFLKNGLIDKEEYKVLLSHYEQYKE